MHIGAHSVTEGLTSPMGPLVSTSSHDPCTLQALKPIQHMFTVSSLMASVLAALAVVLHTAQANYAHPVTIGMRCTRTRLSGVSL